MKQKSRIFASYKYQKLTDAQRDLLLTFYVVLMGKIEPNMRFSGTFVHDLHDKPEEAESKLIGLLDRCEALGEEARKYRQI